MRIFRRRHEQDMAEEFRLHMEREVEAYQASGMPLEEARFAAARKFGNPGGLKEECRDVRQVAFVENFRRDLNYGFRSLLRTPAFTVVAVLSLALGSGANTAIFTVVHAFLLRSLPVPNPDSLALIKVQRPKALLDGLVAADSYSFSYRLFDSLRLQQRSLFSSILATSSTEFVQKTSSGSRSIPGAFVSGEYFQVLQLKPQLGRLIAPADENSLLAVISDSFWSRAFGRDIHAIGQAVQLEGKAVSVVGILPSAFHGVMLGEDPDVFMPLGSEKILHAPFDLGCDDCEWLTVMARMKPNDTLPRLNASLSSVSKSTFANFPLGSMWGNTRDEVLKNKLGAISGRTGYTYLRRMFTRPLRVLMALAVLVVVMACANLASLLLARSAARQREFSVRGALGASRGRLITQILTETLLLSAAGTVAGIPLAYALSKYLVASLFSHHESFQLALVPSPMVILFMTGTMLLCCLAVGLTPALRLTRFSSPLGNGTRTIFSDRSRRLLPRSLLVFQVGLSLVLVTAAILFSGTLFHLREVPLGFNPHGVVILSYSWADMKTTDEQKVTFARRALAQVRSIPGVTSAAQIGMTPLAGSARFGEVSAPASSQKLQVWNNAVSSGYFSTMQTKILEGREFNDTPADHDSMILSSLLARKLFPGQSAVGQSVIYNKKLHRVIGVVEESKYLTVRNEQSVLFTPSEAWTSTYFIRYSGSASSVATQAAKELQQISPDVLVKPPLLMEKLVDQALATERLLAALGNFFGALALLLMAIGLYGTLAYLTARRTPEIGVRMALGAGRWSVLWTVAKENLAVAGIGAILGLVGAVTAVRYVKSFLYGGELLDPLLLLAIVGLIALIAIAATGLPARKAACIDPMEALRCE